MSNEAKKIRVLNKTTPGEVPEVYYFFGEKLYETTHTINSIHPDQKLQTIGQTIDQFINPALGMDKNFDGEHSTHIIVYDNYDDDIIIISDNYVNKTLSGEIISINIIRVIHKDNWVPFYKMLKDRGMDVLERDKIALAIADSKPIVDFYIT